MKRLALLLLWLGTAVPVCADVIAFDHMRVRSAFSPGGSGFTIGGMGLPASSWLGQAVTLSAAGGGPPASRTITGFDVPLALMSGPDLGASEIRLRVRIYDTYSAGAGPVFGSLLSEQTIASRDSAISGFWLGLTLATPDPAWALATPVTVSSAGPIGIAMSLEWFNGSAWVDNPNLRLSTFSTPTGPIVGSSAMPGGTGTYIRAKGASMPGNFNPADLSLLGASVPNPMVGMDMRIWVDEGPVIPLPSAAGLGALGLVVLGARRRRPA